MNAKELAALLNGRNYGDEITKEEAAQAKAAGLVVVYGASDDLMEFEGAIYDEVGCSDGGSALVDVKGLLPDYDNLDVGDKSELRNYFLREDAAVVVEALWDTGGYSWMYQTAIQHETFEIVEDGEPYCRGIVFALADAKPAAPIGANVHDALLEFYRANKAWISIAGHPDATAEDEAKAEARYDAAMKAASEALAAAGLKDAA